MKITEDGSIWHKFDKSKSGDDNVTWAEVVKTAIEHPNYVIEVILAGKGYVRVSFYADATAKPPKTLVELD